MNTIEAFDLFRRIKIKWPNFQIDEDLGLMAEVYLEDLGEFDYEAVKAAYKKFKGERFAPTLSEILEALAPNEVGEAWMARGAGDMGFFEKTDAPRTLAELRERKRAEAAPLGGLVPLEVPSETTEGGQSTG